LKTVTFDTSRLLLVNKNGLEYVDDEGCRCAIDFHSCRENARDLLKIPAWLWARHPNYVGLRNILGEPPYIALASDPPTRFLFSMPGPAAKDPGKESASLEPRDFYEFDLRLNREGGVLTFDMT
jgi:hypothetical protein